MHARQTGPIAPHLPLDQRIVQASIKPIAVGEQAKATLCGLDFTVVLGG